MATYDKHILLNEFQKVLQYYLDKTERIMNLYQDTAETQYFLSALKGTLAFLNTENSTDITFLKKCIDGLIAGQQGRTGNDRLSLLRDELEEELALLKLRYNIN
nr:hypothetical protein [uncultured Allomuricauda sp.]